MGACARAAHGAGGEVLGVILTFLVAAEAPPSAGETIVTPSMHARKMRRFEEADAFGPMLPGLSAPSKRPIELLSWHLLGLHAKPVVFYNPDGFWDPLFALFAQFIDQRLLPAEFAGCWRAVANIDAVIPARRAMPAVRMAIPAVASLS